MKRDVVYVYKANASRELEWSIRSLKNIPHRGVFIIGDMPPYTIEAAVIPIEHIPKTSPYQDVWRKHKIASGLGITDEFIMMNDDMFIFEWDFTIYNRGTIGQHIQQRKGNDQYTRMLRSTKELLERGGYTTTDYTSHTPFIYNRTKLAELISTIEPTIQKGRSVSIRSLYGNIYNVKSEYMPNDTKNPPNYRDFSILSTTEQTFIGEIGDYIRSRL